MRTILRPATVRLALLLTLAATTAQAQVFVLTPAVLDPDAPISDDVKADCRIPELVGNGVVVYLAKRLRKQGGARGVTDLAKAGNGRAVKLTVLAVYGHGATVYSGGKSITVRADIFEHGRFIDSRVVRTNSIKGGAMGTLADACAVYKHIGRGLGAGVSRALATPVEDTASDPGLAVETPALVEKGVPYPDELRQQCATHLLLSAHVFNSVSAAFAGARMARPDEPVEGKRLRISIVELEGKRAGGVSGPKMLAVRADVLEHGKVLATREFEQSTGAILTTKTTCMLLEDAGILVGREIAAWLPQATDLISRNPSPEPVDSQETP